MPSASQAAGETVTSPSPGGVISAFCEPEATTSSPQASVSTGTAPRLETPSTTTSAPAAFAAAASAWMSATTPVDVSECVRKTAFAPPSSAKPRAQVVRARRLTPLVGQRVDLAAVRRRELLPALAEVPGGDDDDAIARRAEVRDRGLHRPRAREVKRRTSPSWCGTRLASRSRHSPKTAR